MNFLGHAIFTDGPANTLFASVTGDYIDKSNPDITAEMRSGLAMHTFLDGLPDTSPLLVTSRSQLHDLGTGYGNVILDICLDHVLASNWNALFSTPLDMYTVQLYDILTQRLHLLTPTGQERFTTLIEEDWLGSYEREDGLRQAVQRLGNRILARPRFRDRGQKVLTRIDEIVSLVPEISTEVIPALPAIRTQVEGRMTQLEIPTEGRIQWKDNASFRESRGRNPEKW